MTLVSLSVTVRCDRCGKEEVFSNIDPDGFYADCDFTAGAGWGYMEHGGECFDLCPDCVARMGERI